MYKSGRKTFIYGFALAVKSILQISEKLFKDIIIIHINIY